MPRLTKEYRQNHMKESSSEKYEADSLETFADALIDRILATATEQFETNSEERDEVQVSLPVTLRPEDVEGAQ